MDLRLQLNAAPMDWEVLTSRKRVTDALSEWQVRPHKQHAHCDYMSLSDCSVDDRQIGSARFCSSVGAASVLESTPPHVRSRVALCHPFLWVFGAVRVLCLVTAGSGGPRDG